MTKREICDTHRTIAYYSGLGGLEVRFIEYGINDFIYLLKFITTANTIIQRCTATVAGFRTLSESDA